MSLYNRNRKRWTVNECLALQREFELLEWSIDEIATKHKRTPKAIMFKLDQEGLAKYNILCNEYYNFNPTTESITVDSLKDDDTKNDNNDDTKNDTKNDNNEYDLNELKNHIISLEKQISNLTELFMMQNKNRNSKLGLSLFN